MGKFIGKKVHIFIALLLFSCQLIQTSSRQSGESRDDDDGVLLSSNDSSVDELTYSSHPDIPTFEFRTCCPFQHSFDPSGPSLGRRECQNPRHFRPFERYPGVILNRPASERDSHHLKWCRDGEIQVRRKLVMDAQQLIFQIYNYPNGQVNIEERIYERDEYCVDSIKSVRTGISYQFLLDVFHCKLNCSEDKPCIKKCCDFDESLNSNFTCESDKSQKSTTSLLLRLGRGSDNLNELLSDNHPRLIVNSINFLSTCEPIDLKLTSEIKLLRNGNVQVRYDASSLVELGDYCVDIYKDKPIASYCAKDLLPFIGGYVKYQLAYCTISTFFILLTLIIYLLVWKKHGINGYMQFAFILSAFFYFAMRLARRSYELATNLHPRSIIPDRLDTFFTIGMFANLVNLSFHMFYTFWNITPETGIRTSGQLRRLFFTVSTCWIVAGVTVLSELFMVKLCIKLFCFTGMIWGLKLFEQLLRNASFDRGWFWDMVQFLTYMYGIVLFFVFVVTNDKITKALTERFPAIQSLKKSTKSRTPKEPSTTHTQVHDDKKSRVHLLQK
ncbi:uncharacterized protein LOC110854225 isoform X2 [Folsomia candida]|uniref:uncharacterized protein LOC110854225 isoform X2 n=1 Tax=Folsomia candida TaxID=158441 RepID=UPI0016052B1E|nr:uncharacterized protein LOC110854225 isoform X2 [Folsomia candida]